MSETAKERNEACRSCLQDAIRSIRKAATYVPFVHANGLVETLQQLKAKIKKDFRPREDS